MSSATGPGQDPLLAWLARSLGREAQPWDATQVSFLESLLEREEGPRVLASLVVTTLRLRQSAFKPDQLGTLGNILPAIEAFWDDPTPRTFADLRIARW